MSAYTYDEREAHLRRSAILLEAEFIPLRRKLWELTRTFERVVFDAGVRKHLNTPYWIEFTR